MRAPVLAAIAGVALVAMPSRAHAEYEAGVFGGYHMFSEKNRLGRFDRDPPDTAYTPSAFFGGRFAYVPGRYFMTELQAAVIPTTLRNDRTSATIVHFRGHLVFQLPLGRFRPFLLGGVGSATVIPTDPLYLRRDTDLNLHGGIGVKVDVTKNWGIRFDWQTAAVPRTDAGGFALESGMFLGFHGNFPWAPEPPPAFDQDGDQITDDKDDCPEKAGDIRFGGCPDPNAAEEEAEEEEAEESKEEPKADPKDPKAPEPNAPAKPEAPKP